MKAKILSKFKYNKEEDESLVNDFATKLYTEIELLLAKKNNTYENTISYYKDSVDKSINTLKRVLPKLLYDAYNVSINDLESGVIDVSILINMENEIKTIKEGDIVFVIVAEPNYIVKEDRIISLKRYILEFEVLNLNYLGIPTLENSLGITAQESPFGCMITLDWCELVVKKESYEMLFKKEKNSF